MKKIEKSVLNRASTLLLRLAIVAIGTVVLALCIFALPSMWHAVPQEFPARYTYVAYAILSAFYLAAVPFFVALYQAMLLLGYIDKNTAFSRNSVIALKRIAVCGVLISLVFAAMMPFLYIWADNDDAPGLILIGMALVGAAFTVAVFAAVMQRVLRQVIKIKSENDLTV